MSLDPSQSLPGLEQKPRIVALGASAGGLEALRLFFSHLPPDTGLCFLVLQHLDPERHSALPEILSRHTLLPVRLARDLDEPVADSVLILPPGMSPGLERGRLRLPPRTPERGPALPIDRFLLDLAAEEGERGTAVILSGAGADGARGVEAVSRAVGLVLVQTLESAAFDGMPRAAEATGAAQFLLAPQDMPLVLLKALERRAGAAGPESGPPAETSLDPLFSLLHERFGIDFRFYKPSTVSRRIERRATIRQCPDLECYARLLQEEPRELDQLCHDLLIGVTSFFRDEPAFRFLETRVIPGLLENAGAREVRAWVPACATGEEVYSLAMLFREAAGLRGQELRVRLFATDVYQRSLAAAAQGLYALDAEGLTEARRRWFTREAGGLRVRPELRRMVVFAGHNLIQDPPFTRMDLVVCRNLLIYLRPEAQSRILHVFHFALRRGGVLFLGPSESLAGLEEEFEPLDRHWKIFAKRRDVCLPGRRHWPARSRAEPSPESAPDLDLAGLLERCGGTGPWPWSRCAPLWRTCPAGGPRWSCPWSAGTCGPRPGCPATWARPPGQPGPRAWPGWPPGWSAPPPGPIRAGPRPPRPSGGRCCRTWPGPGRAWTGRCLAAPNSRFPRSKQPLRIFHSLQRFAGAGSAFRCRTGVGWLASLPKVFPVLDRYQR